MSKRKISPKTKAQQKLLLEELKRNPKLKVGGPLKSEIKGWTDMPLFKQDLQIDLFDSKEGKEGKNED